MKDKFEDASSIIVKTDAPRVRYLPEQFEMPKEKDNLTLQFDQELFDVIRDEFRSIGMPDYARQLEAVDEMDDEAFAALVTQAVASIEVCREPTEHENWLWGAYSPALEAWVSGEELPACVTQHAAHMVQ